MLQATRNDKIKETTMLQKAEAASESKLVEKIADLEPKTFVERVFYDSALMFFLILFIFLCLICRWLVQTLHWLWH